MICSLCADWIGQKGETQVQQHKHDWQQSELAQLFGRIEDRLILVSLPVLVMCLIFWMIVSAYPVIAVVGNLIISIAVLLIFCVVLIRLTEVAYRWIKRGSDTPNDDDLFYIPGAVGIGFLVAFDIGALVDTIIHAGQASGVFDTQIDANPPKKDTEKGSSFWQNSELCESQSSLPSAP